MKKIKEVNIEGDRIFLKKNKYLGWTVVNPFKIDGKINWKNLLIGGNWVRFFIVIMMVILILLAIMEYSNVVKIANECLNNSHTIIVNTSQWIN